MHDEFDEFETENLLFPFFGFQNHMIEEFMEGKKQAFVCSHVLPVWWPFQNS